MITAALANVTAAQADTLTTNGSDAITITLSSAPVIAPQLLSIDNKTSIAVNANSITQINGTVAAIKAVYGSNGIAGLGDKAVTITDTTLNASDLAVLDVNTTGVINAASVSTITGTIAALLATYTAYAGATISGLGNEAVTISDFSIDAGAFN